MSETIDSVTQLDSTPAIVHISDIHGYLKDARNALSAVGETDAFDPIIKTNETGTIHWANNDYILVINGDLIDRGPDNEACIQMVWQLLNEAPAGRVRYHIGNHELPILMPRIRGWPDTYSTELTDTQRREFLERIVDGEITMAFEGYNYIYSHAGSNRPIDPTDVNEDLLEAAVTVLEHIGDQNESQTHKRLVEQYNRLFGVGKNSSRGPSAGLCWLDFKHLNESSPPQVVGHSMRERPVRKGNIVCGNVIRMNQRSEGGEGVLVETPNELTSIRRGRGGAVRTNTI